MAFTDEFKSYNFSIYGQWLGVLSIFLCIALGIANIFHASLVIIFSIICIVEGLVIFFVEIPFFLKICPLTDRFTFFIKTFNNNLPRAGFYLAMALIQYFSCFVQVTSLLVPAIFLTFASISYACAAIKHQEFTASSTLGGTGIARQMFTSQV
ncbi:Golgi apparatus membrane protein TVP18 [Nadsonia fulvescens var. elongata DSM 6958]|uniref:Golgi apparatus membrane protein TVP18 n=1 Tax=Nadsonia fulvescens var. elongata DSM 6958 TaxID=857566 RepID=A0A1E3PG76_9ASCO|nr:Golgi apparatus membrane protein TVP18 [Nadsonia fulvescens var. elongata DSM 6958]